MRVKINHIDIEENSIAESKSKCQSEVRHLFKELESWRDESQRQFSNIINCHSESINKAINDLVEEVGDLQAKLSTTTHERNDLMETVKNLSGGIRQLRATLPVDNHRLEAQDIDSSEMGLSYMEEQAIEKPRASAETEDQVEFEEIEVQQQDKYTLDYGNSSSNELSDGDANDTENLDPDEVVTVNDGEDHEKRESMKFCSSLQKSQQNVFNCSQAKTWTHHKNDFHSDKQICPKCSFSFSTGENLIIHLKQCPFKFGTE